MEPPMFSRVVLVNDVPVDRLRAGDVGVLVDRHIGSNGTVGYSVEFFDAAGNTVAVASVAAEDVRVPEEGEVLTTRKRVA